MCGIFGLFQFKECADSLDVEKARASILKMKHRGPDAQIISQIDSQTLLGHLRLSIIDLGEQSNQPFESKNGFLSLTYNGEIYNYLELREELIKKGHQFKTNGDTEVLLVAYEEWGEECVKRFNGMWSFVIYDKKNDILFCSRDRFGIKPFKYAVHNNQFIFSSEIKPIIHYFETLRKPNYELIANFCNKSLGSQLEYTWFKNILQLMPAHNMKVYRDGTIQLNRYWSYPTKTVDISFEDAEEKYRELFIDAVNLRMRSDVPVGTTLSSGVDSTSIVYTLRKSYKGPHNTYTAFSDANDYLATDKQYLADKEKEINEIDIVKNINQDLGFDGHAINTDYNNYVAKLKDAIFYLESGHPSPAVIPLDQIYKKVSEKVIVVLEGQGADELLGGYLNLFLGFHILDLFKQAKFVNVYQELQKFKKAFSIPYAAKLLLRSYDIPFFQNLYQKRTGLDRLYIGPLKDQKYLRDAPLHEGKIKKKLSLALYEQHSGTLNSLLHYGDALCMKHSLENRVPFMDHRLVEFGFQLPSEYKINDGFGKYIHRKALEDIAPKEILFCRDKYGFNTPISKILNATGDNSPCAILMEEKTRNRGLFAPEKLKEIIEAHQSGKPGFANLLFRLLNVELWFRIFFDQEISQN